MIYFISGPLQADQNFFEAHYVSQLKEILEKDPRAIFVVGDAPGIDRIAQLYLKEQKISTVTVYHMFKSPRWNVGNFPTLGGFRTDEERDAAMTKASDRDVLYIVSPLITDRTTQDDKKKALTKGKLQKQRITGTERNKLRRELLKI
jgi:hypothetical protein